MKTTIINIPKGTKYLSDVMDELPKNCLFNKGIAGCGGTTLALTNNNPTVVCVPYIFLGDNKAIQSLSNKEVYPHEVFSVNGNVTPEEFAAYLQRATVPKIMVTYNSLKRVIDQINPKDYEILIDEYHCLFTQYSFRHEAALTVLNNYNAFKSFTFITATPLYEEFLLEELKGIDTVKAEWEEALPVNVTVTQCKNGVERTIKHQIDRIISGELKGNYYFFVNSVKFMEKMIANCHLTEENCRVIYSDNRKTTLRIKRGKPSDEPRKINFITSCAFEGCDFYDEEGKIVIVSDGRRSNTLIDISTQFLQIAGRIRDSKYNGEICHVLSTTRYSNQLSYQDFKGAMDDEIKKENKFYNNLLMMEDIDCRIEAAKGRYLKFFRIDEESKTITLDLNAPKIDLYNYKILNSDYLSMYSVCQQYKKNNVILDSWKIDHTAPELLPMDDITSFEKTIKELKRLNDSREDLLGNHNYVAYHSAASRIFPFLTDAIKQIGYDGIEKLRYKTSDIRRKVIQLSPRTSENSDVERMAKLLHHNPKVFPGAVLTKEYVKDTMNNYYQELGIDKKATANDIDKYYAVKEKTKSVDGKQQRAVAILNAKIPVS